MSWLLSGWFAVAGASDMAAEGPGSTAVDQALGELEAGNLVEGCVTLERVVEQHPGSREARWAEQIARTVNGLRANRCTWVEGAVEIATDGRTELIVSQGVVAPVWLATALPLYFPEATSTGTVSLAIVGGLGLGIGGTYLATQNRRVTTGQAMLVYTGEVLGVWYGAWLEGALADEFTGRPAHLGFLVGGLGGVGAAVAFKDASAGDVALFRSGMVWGTALGAVAVVASRTNGRGVITGLGIGTTAGLGVAAALAPRLDLRRGQVNTINLGGYAGALTGGAAVLLTQPDAPGAALMIGGGMVAGLSVAAVLVSRRDRATRTAGLNLAPPQLTMMTDRSGAWIPAVGLNATW